VTPVILHVIGVGSTVMLKFIFEMSPGIGHLEGMYVTVKCYPLSYASGLCAPSSCAGDERDELAIRRCASAVPILLYLFFLRVCAGT
jgi:hypothetical protein